MDGVPLSRIFPTTFTRTAADEIKGRLIKYRQLMVDAGLTEATALDHTKLQVGTLHGLAYRISSGWRR